jgi:uncharacterized protein YutE (UPF0331/DUF86 family)
VTLRRPAVDARLRRLHQVTSRLRRYRERGHDAIRADEDLQWLVERGLQLGCEIVLDVGNHVLVGAFGRPSERYEEILSGLAAEHVITPELRAELVGLGGFRNVLVHGYLDVDLERVLDALDHAPERFERFAQELHDWLERAPGTA